MSMKTRCFVMLAALFAVVSCTTPGKEFSREEVVAHSLELGFPEDNLYFIKPELRKEMIIELNEARLV